ncbi:MAG: hypothetical protein ABH869_04775 [Candidatus Omnitrophota bacterium]
MRNELEIAALLARLEARKDGLSRAEANEARSNLDGNKNIINEIENQVNFVDLTYYI